MLVKLSSPDLVDDYGLLITGKKPHVHMFENGIVPLTAALQPQQVLHINAVWVEKDVKVSCDLADTEEKKKAGLQAYPTLPRTKGLYFPYPGCSDVTFHQGKVAYPLDLLFLRDSTIVQLELDTKVGGTDLWSCADCDGVIEVNSGFCKKHNVKVGDQLILLAFSQGDIDEYQEDVRKIMSETTETSYRYRSSNLIRGIIGEDYYG